MKTDQTVWDVIRRLKQKALANDSQMPELSRVDAYRSRTGSLYFVVSADVGNKSLRDIIQSRYIRVSNHNTTCDKLYGNVIIKDQIYTHRTFMGIYNWVFELIYAAGMEIQAEVNAKRGLFRKERKISKVC